MQIFLFLYFESFDPAAYTHTEKISEALERVKKHWSGHRGAVTKYLKEAKHTLDSDAELDEKRLVKVKVLSNIMKEKLDFLNTLDKEVLVTCPTNDIEREIEESKEIKCKTVKVRTEIEGQLDGARRNLLLVR